MPFTNTLKESAKPVTLLKLGDALTKLRKELPEVVAAPFFNEKSFLHAIKPETIAIKAIVLINMFFFILIAFRVKLFLREPAFVGVIISIQCTNPSKFWDIVQ